MSVDTYFCFCCLSTNELTNLFGSNTDLNYDNMIKELFSIKVLQEDEDDNYICEECVSRLKQAYDFRNQVFETLNILKVNGLINMCKVKGDQIIIKKVNAGYISDIEEKCKLENYKKDMDFKYGEENKQDIKPVEPEPKLIKQEQIEQNNLENIQIINGAEIIRPIIDNSPLNFLLEREKRITVTRKRKRERYTVKREPLYEVTDDFKCQLCSMVLPNVYVYHRHMNQHFPNHICESCGKGFPTEKRLKRHMPSHRTGSFKCQSCDAEFSNYNTLNSHRQRKHSTVQLYKCPLCAERFPTYTRRALHLTAAHAQPAGKYACNICGRRFLLAGNLSSHMRYKHLKVKRHFCSVCDAGFYQKQELKGHMATHTGYNEFQCNLCPKTYPRKKALNVHMRIHTDDKRFCCDICGKKFIQKCTLLSHIKIHNRKVDASRRKIKMAKNNECEQPILIDADMECYNYI